MEMWFSFPISKSLLVKKHMVFDWNELIIIIKDDSTSADQAILLLLIAKYLERVGDHAVNIGEWVEYAIKGTHTKF